MIADLLNMLVGLWLAHSAIFPNALGLGDPALLAGAALTIGLALWARQSDTSTWQSTTAVVAGMSLAILALAHQIIHVSSVLMFWGVLSVGLISAIVSLWAALYRPDQLANLSLIHI